MARRSDLRGGGYLLLLLLLLLLGLAAACAKRPPRESAPLPILTPTPATEPRRRMPPPGHSTRPNRPAGKPPPAGAADHRVVAIGDLHGDVDAARRTLRLAGAIDARDRWIGGPLTVVQVGDQIDRGDHDRAVLDLFEGLRDPARRAGGAVHSLLGNHELMNVLGRMHHVSARAFEQFVEFGPRGAVPAHLAGYPARMRGRFAAFRPGGAYARRLARRKVVLQLGRTVFVHGGLLPEHVRYGLERANREVSAFLRGERKTLSPAVWSKTGLLWSRKLSTPKPKPKHCRMLSRALTTLGAERLVVGHTRQRRGINSACAGRVWRIDVSLSGFYGKKPAQILEVRVTGARVLTEPAAPR